MTIVNVNDGFVVVLTRSGDGMISVYNMPSFYSFEEQRVLLQKCLAWLLRNICNYIKAKFSVVQ